MNSANEINRKSFFHKVGKGILALAIMSSFPIKYFSSLSKKTKADKIKVTIHPSAVKRNVKV